ncbi:MAG: hypothetical protein CML66_03410 [Rhodobacteraceae bacterium]|nr:hypothetical protein [Paracoccaceae bacterium]MAY46643.1 hypothetical protein [Paracoccaceae bacterium]
MLVSARPDEARAFADLLAEAFTDYALGLGRPAPGPYDWVPARLEAGEGFWIGNRQGATVLKIAGQRAKIDVLGIRPGAQGGGIGARAIAAIEAHVTAQGARALHLQTAQRYTRLVAFYSRQGFRVNGVGPHEDGIDDMLRVFMVKRL